MLELRDTSSHLLAGWVTVVVLTVVPAVMQSIVAAFAFLVDGEPLAMGGLLLELLLAFVAAVVYTALAVFPTVIVLSRVVQARGWPGWWVVLPPLLVSGVVDAILFSRGYWVPDTTLPRWPVWVAVWAFGPAVYIYWSTLRLSVGERRGP